MPKFNVRVQQTEMLQKVFEAESAEEARQAAFADEWKAEHGWKHDRDLGLYDIWDVTEIKDTKV